MNKYVISGMGSLGALLGFWIAWSKSPIVATIIPLMFGIMGTASGFSLFKLDYTKEANKLKLRVVGLSLFALCTSTLAAMLVALFTRPIVNEFFAEKSSPLVVSSKSPIKAVLARARLRALGASEGEIVFALDPKRPSTSPVDHLSNIVKATQSYLRIYEKLQAKDLQDLKQVGWNSFNAEDAALTSKLFLTEYESLSKSPGIDATNAAFMLERVLQVNYGKLTDFTSDKNGVLVRMPDLVSARIQLAAAINRAKMDALGDMPENMVREVTQFLQATNNSNAKSNSRDVAEVAWDPSGTLR